MHDPRQPHAGRIQARCPVCLRQHLLIDKAFAMDSVTVAPKHQIVIPKSVRSDVRLSCGQTVQVVFCDNRIELLRAGSARRMRGFFDDIDTEVPRDGDRV